MAKLIDLMDSDIEIVTIKENVAWEINYRGEVIGEVNRVLSLCFVALPFMATTYKNGYSLGQTAHDSLRAAVLFVVHQLGLQNERIVQII